MKSKAFAFTLIILMSSALYVACFAQAQIEGVTIIGVFGPDGNMRAFGNSELPVTVTATIPTYNGAYELYFNQAVVASGMAEGYNVKANFTIPNLPAGAYALSLLDKSADITGDQPFNLIVSYSIKAVVSTAPAQLQEGADVSLNITALSADANKTHTLEILVVPPAGVGTNFTKTISITTSSTGTSNTLVSFPSAGFTSTNTSTVSAGTVYVGTYSAYLNKTTDLTDAGYFTVGFTDATQYHRQETVKIRAPGYQPSQVASVAIKLNDAVVFSQQVSASNQGVVQTTWVVPSNASIGTYNFAITPLTTPSKLIPDTQNIVIPGYSVKFEAKNLGNKAVNQVKIEARDSATGTVANATTNANGIASMALENGAYAVAAYWNDVKVGDAQSTVNGNGTFTVSCRLTDLMVKVVDKNGALIPFVNLNAVYRYTNRYGQTLDGSSVGTTDLTGTYTFASILPGISYNVAASKYNTVFNSGNSSISALPAQASFQATILCPDRSLSVTTVDYNRAVLPNARVTLIEQASGIFYSTTTDGNGNAQLDVTFGQYRAEVYTSGNILLNDTVVSALSDVHETIRCVLYNLPVSVKVVDFFGNGIDNVNVQLSRPGMDTLSYITQGDGTATFPNAVGGNMDIKASLPNDQNAFVARNLVVDSASTVQLSMGNFVSVGGLLVSASVLATIILVVIAVVLVLIVEVFRRTGFRLPRKSKV